jgi:hypothetical protein
MENFTSEEDELNNKLKNNLQNQIEIIENNKLDLNNQKNELDDLKL